MPQLRDTKTGELLAEGTPLELALAAEELGRDEVLFDDVGDSFDPAAVLEAHRGELDGLTKASKDTKLPKADRDSLKATLEQRKAEADVGELVDDAGRRLEEARARMGA